MKMKFLLWFIGGSFSLTFLFGGISVGIKEMNEKGDPGVLIIFFCIFVGIIISLLWIKSTKLSGYRENLNHESPNGKSKR